MPRLSEIAYRFPHSAAPFLADLRGLLAGVPQCSAAPGRLTLTPAAPPGALPLTVFETAPIAVPQLRFTTSDGGSFVLEAATGAPDGIPMDAFTARLAGHVYAVDHTGMNLPAASVPVGRWRDTVHTIAGQSTMYRYPTGDPWPFVLPSTAAELDGDIEAFVAGREPRFELVHDEWLDEPLWQFALRTDLARADLEALFPDPFGTAFPGLGDVFRAVTVRSSPRIRFDLYYRSGALSDWETGEWLVTEGGRIRGERGA